MGKIVANPLPAFGFLTVLEDSQHGFFGGYLLLSELGRPLEFHCSTPVQPNEAQKILYGASLRPYVLGELIGQTLVAEAKLSVQTVLTDQQEILSLTLLRDEPIVCITGSDQQISNDDSQSTVPEFELGSLRIFGSSTCAWQPEQIRSTITPLTHYVDLMEPFQRIREAIQEAQRISEPHGDNHHESTAAA